MIEHVYKHSTCPGCIAKLEIIRELDNNNVYPDDVALHQARGSTQLVNDAEPERFEDRIATVYSPTRIYPDDRMYILFCGDTPIEIHKDLDHAKERMLYKEESNLRCVTAGRELPVQYSIKEVLETENINVTRCHGCSIVLTNTNKSSDALFCGCCVKGKS